MQIVSYNVNGIRAAIKKGWVNWLTEHQFDVIAIQEAKASQEQVDCTPIEELGYHINWHSAEKKGYSGVVTFSKEKPLEVEAGCGIERYDNEGRILRTTFKNFTLLNCYFPSGTSGDERQAFKMDFLEDFMIWVQRIKAKYPNIIVVGDYNIAHSEMDIHNPKSNKNTSGFKPEERAWMTQWFESGFIDAFREKNPSKVEYSWWSYRASARAKNKGWRIDYQSVATPMKDKILAARQLTDVVHSDHCPVLMEIAQ